MNNTIELFVKSALTIPLNDLNDFQKNLKSISDENLEKIKERIKDRGFRAPIFVWKSEDLWFIIDGHQRRLALIGLMADGYNIPDIPCCEILAEDYEDARQTLLEITGQYSEFNTEELTKWLDTIPNIISDTLRFVDTEIKLDLKFDFGLDRSEDEQKDNNKRVVHVCPNCAHEWE